VTKDSVIPGFECTLAHTPQQRPCTRYQVRYTHCVVPFFILRHQIDPAHSPRVVLFCWRSLQHPLHMELAHHNASGEAWTGRYSLPFIRYPPLEAPTRAMSTSNQRVAENTFARIALPSQTTYLRTSSTLAPSNIASSCTHQSIRGKSVVSPSASSRSCT
jgi:hypothetical protein